jgi:hypothetical protein
VFEARSIVIEEHLYTLSKLSFAERAKGNRLPTSKNPTISVFEVRSIAFEEYLYTLSKLSIDWLGFDRSWLIRWRSLRFAESIFGAMVLGSINIAVVEVVRS